MSEPVPQEPPAPWIHIGECPLCGNGLCRLRYGVDPQGVKRLYAMCDECEAIWLKPDLLSKYQFPDAEDPLCPISGEALYGPKSGWARPEDLQGTDWESEVIIDLPVDVIDDSEPETFVTQQDQASVLDVPPITRQFGRREDKAAGLDTDDWAYGQDEPRPGC
jgi:hypothetical protein